jgi:hypothetical protein
LLFMYTNDARFMCSLLFMYTNDTEINYQLT